jgi:hypothetical protein
VATETAIQIQQADQGIKLIQPFCRNGSNNGQMAFFPLYFSEILGICKKWWPRHINALKLTNFLLVVPEV